MCCSCVILLLPLVLESGLSPVRETLNTWNQGNWDRLLEEMITTVSHCCCPCSLSGTSSPLDPTHFQDVLPATNCRHVLCIVKEWYSVDQRHRRVSDLEEIHFVFYCQSNHPLKRLSKLISGSNSNQQTQQRLYPQNQNWKGKVSWMAF